MTCIHCRYRPVLRSWRQPAIIVKTCRRNGLCLDCYASLSMRWGYAMAESMLKGSAR